MSCDKSAFRKDGGFFVFALFNIISAKIGVASWLRSPNFCGLQSVTI